MAGYLVIGNAEGVRLRRAILWIQWKKGGGLLVFEVVREERDERTCPRYFCRLHFISTSRHGRMDFMNTLFHSFTVRIFFLRVKLQHIIAAIKRTFNHPLERAI